MAFTYLILFFFVDFNTSPSTNVITHIINYRIYFQIYNVKMLNFESICQKY